MAKNLFKIRKKEVLNVYDTVCLKSPEISRYVEKIVSTYCKLMQGVNLETGEILYEITSGELLGSYDYRIRVNIKDYDWVNRAGIPEKVKLDYKYIEVECSVHKLLMNHNCFGGPDKIKDSIRYVICFLENCMSVKLPCWEEWEVKRIDVAYIYRFKNDKEIKEYLFKLKNMYYQRRKITFNSTGFFVPGSTTTVKGYMKYPEFMKHDYKRVKKYCLKMRDLEIGKSREIVYNKIIEEFDNVKNSVKGVFRIEVEIHKRKLEEICKCKVENLDDDVLNEIFEKELSKIFWNVSDESMKICNRSVNVLKRLNEMYGDSMGRILFGTWSMLATFGVEYTKENLSNRTFYRHKKLIEKANCVWDISDLHIDKDFNVEIFRPTIKNSDNYVSDIVRQKLVMVG